MTTVRQYVSSLRSVARTVGRSLGLDVGFLNREDRVQLNLITAMNCVLIKLLVDQGVLTDAQVTAAYTAFLNDPNAYPDIPPVPFVAGPSPAGTGQAAPAQGSAYDAVVGP